MVSYLQADGIKGKFRNYKLIEQHEINAKRQHNYCTNAIFLIYASMLVRYIPITVFYIACYVSLYLKASIEFFPAPHLSIEKHSTFICTYEIYTSRPIHLLVDGKRKIELIPKFFMYKCSNRFGEWESDILKYWKKKRNGKKMYWHALNWLEVYFLSTFRYRF